jgi:hypothetical protein
MAAPNRPASLAGPRPALIAGLGLSFVVLLALIWYTFLRYPASVAASGNGPKASLPIWLGDAGATIAYLALGALLALLYLGVAAVGARASSPTSERPWRTGVSLALLGGAIWLLLDVATKLIPALEFLSLPSALLVPGLPALAGALVARRTGQLALGALAGFWCGVTIAPLLGVLALAQDHVFATTLLHTSWAHDRLCAPLAGDALAACEMSDDLGFVATTLVLMPFVGWLFGLVGGAFGLALRPGPASETPDTTRTINRLVAPGIFSAALAAIFVAELIWRLW